MARHNMSLFQMLAWGFLILFLSNPGVRGMLPGSPDPRPRRRDSGLGALRIVLCKTESGIAHAVLTVFTDRGEFVLDNHVLGLWPWRQRPYD